MRFAGWRGFTLRNAAGGLLGAGCRTADQSNHEQQDNGPDEGHEDDARESAERRGHTELAKEPAAHESAENTDYDIADDSVACAAHNQRGEYASDEAHDEPGEQFH